ncbi:ABC transporter ATP-binding protein [Aerococcus tenax]|uniref:ABC transporter ATP-binding protein n=1 Tax=Aerococcus tenax TaxID=3078812 RepID=A0A5N1BJH0_9LACT|nr:ABC transporter ATP-binding protein [Aerococcus urinae]RAW05799.1 ABC transporter ATP-binding protein [Aerococcus urinae]
MLLTAKDISYSYGRQSDFHLSHISLDIEAGSVTGLIGPNGSGKTTLFDCLNGRKSLASGQVVFEGQDLHAIPLKERAKKIAVVQQSHRNQLLLSVFDIVSLGRSPYQTWLDHGSKEDQEIVKQVIDMVGLSDYRDKQLQELSGGQRQLVWLALALAQEPDLLFLDEPTTYLDIRNQIHFLNLIHRLNEEKGLTVVMILHDLNQVLRYCDYAYLLSEGQLIAGGKPADVLSESIIEETYQVHSDRLHHPKGHFVLDFY